MIKHKRCLIFGFAGSIGEELTRQLAKHNKIYGVDLDETRMFDLVEELNIKGRIGNIEDSVTIEEVFQEFKPDIVFHCAARKHVTPNEFYPLEAIRTNIIGTHNIIKCCQKYEVNLINISTDKVVNGESIMGLSKKIAEKMVKNANYISVRFGNVMGSRGSVLPIWQRQIDTDQPITVTDPKMERYMMTIPEACELVIQAAEKANRGEIWIMDMGKKVNIMELARNILGKADRSYPIDIIGSRPGETLTEKLMTAEEEQQATHNGKFWVLK